MNNYTETCGMEMSDSDLLERYNISDHFNSEKDVRDYVYEYAVNQNFYPLDAAHIDEIARRIWHAISE